MSAPKFAPEIWSAKLVQRLRDNLIVGITGHDDNPRRILQRTPRSKAWLKARNKFIQQWAALNAAGLANEYLENEYCGECAGELIPTTSNVETTWIANPNYDPELAAKTLNEQQNTYGIPITKRPTTW